jgi:YD repeat-containing protein
MIGTLAVCPLSHAGTTTYTYDEFDRLKEADFDDGTENI